MLEIEQWMRLGEVLLVAFEMRRNCGVHVISSALYMFRCADGRKSSKEEIIY